MGLKLGQSLVGVFSISAPCFSLVGLACSSGWPHTYTYVDSPWCSLIWFQGLDTGQRRNKEMTDTCAEKLGFWGSKLSDGEPQHPGSLVYLLYKVDEGGGVTAYSWTRRLGLANLCRSLTRGKVSLQAIAIKEGECYRAHFLQIHQHLHT